MTRVLVTRRHRLAIASVICAACIAAGVSPAQSPSALPATTAEWDLGDLYPSVEAWNSAYTKTRDVAAKLERYKGTLGRSSAAMRQALSAISDLRRTAARLSAYASLQGDEDLRVAPAQERRQQAQTLETLIAEKSAWVAPEIIAIGRTKIDAFVARDAVLRQRFDFMLAEALRYAPHTLGTEAESVLAASGDVLAQPDQVYQQLAEAELPNPTVMLSSGERVRLDEAAYTKLRSQPLRADRKAVFDAFWGTWKAYEGTFGANLAAKVKGSIFTAHARRFGNALEAELFGEAMPPEVYRTLVAQANAALPTLHRYLRLRKRLLGIDGELAYHDGYTPLFALPDLPAFTVDEAKRLTLAALAPLGDEYLGLLRRGFAGRWMNILPRQGKAGGAYVNGAYGVHPYLLLNHNDDYESLWTFAHEWGHAIHTLLADARQPHEKAGYSGFIAESAAIANEMLLNEYLVSHARSRQEKLFYLGEALESMRTTFYRQVLFAEFQLAMYDEVEQGRALSGESLTRSYCTLLKRYYGEAEDVMRIDPAYCTEWAYVRHFNFGFYVYQYATSMAGAAQLTAAILEHGAPARDRYLAMLRAGGSDHPYTLYKRAGVDMASPEPYRALVARMDRVMDEIEALERQP